MLSLYPPGSLYEVPPQPQSGRVRLVEGHDWDAELRAPIWVGKGTHLPQVAGEESTLLVVDVRCLEKPTVAASIKPQGWAVLPVFADGAVDSGVHQLPLFVGSPTVEALEALSRVAKKTVADWQRSLGRIAQDNELGLVDGGSVTVTLLDAQRYGELERPERLPPSVKPDTARLPVSFVKKYLTDLPKSKPLRSLVGKIKATRSREPLPSAEEEHAKGRRKKEVLPMLTLEELQDESLAAFREAVGLSEPGMG
jgi:hypothetical protein